MSLARKVNRNKLKKEFEKHKTKRTAPLSQYKFKTQEDLQKERAEAVTNQMLETAKKSMDIHPQK